MGVVVERRHEWCGSDEEAEGSESSTAIEPESTQTHREQRRGWNEVTGVQGRGGEDWGAADDRFESSVIESSVSRKESSVKRAKSVECEESDKVKRFAIRAVGGWFAGSDWSASSPVNWQFALLRNPLLPQSVSMGIIRSR